MVWFEGWDFCEVYVLEGTVGAAIVVGAGKPDEAVSGVESKGYGLWGSSKS
jgi:hypothetical protein